MDMGPDPLNRALPDDDQDKPYDPDAGAESSGWRYRGQYDPNASDMSSGWRYRGQYDPNARTVFPGSSTEERGAAPLKVVSGEAKKRKQALHRTRASSPVDQITLPDNLVRKGYKMDPPNADAARDAGDAALSRVGQGSFDEAIYQNDNPGSPRYDLGPAPIRPESAAQQAFNRNAPPQSQFVTPSRPAPKTYREASQQTLHPPKPILAPAPPQFKIGGVDGKPKTPPLTQDEQINAKIAETLDKQNRELIMLGHTFGIGKEETIERLKKLREHPAAGLWEMTPIGAFMTGMTHEGERVGKELDEAGSAVGMHPLQTEYTRDEGKPVKRFTGGGEVDGIPMTRRLASAASHLTSAIPFVGGLKDVAGEQYLQAGGEPVSFGDDDLSKYARNLSIAFNSPEVLGTTLGAAIQGVGLLDSFKALKDAFGRRARPEFLDPEDPDRALLTSSEPPTIDGQIVRPKLPSPPGTEPTTAGRRALPSTKGLTPKQLEAEQAIDERLYQNTKTREEVRRAFQQIPPESRQAALDDINRRGMEAHRRGDRKAAMEAVDHAWILKGIIDADERAARAARIRPDAEQARDGTTTAAPEAKPTVASIPPDESGTPESKEIMRKLFAGEELTAADQAIVERARVRGNLIHALSPEEAAKLPKKDYDLWMRARRGGGMSPQAIRELTRAIVARGEDVEFQLNNLRNSIDYLLTDPAELASADRTPEEVQQLAARNKAHNAEIADAMAELVRALDEERAKTKPAAATEATSAPVSETKPVTTPTERPVTRPTAEAPKPPKAMQPKADEPLLAQGMVRLYHGSAVPGRYDGSAWFSPYRDYAGNYREGGELQYVDVPWELYAQHGYDPEAGLYPPVELDSSATGLRKPLIITPKAKKPNKKSKDVRDLADQILAAGTTREQMLAELGIQKGQKGWGAKPETLALSVALKWLAEKKVSATAAATTPPEAPVKTEAEEPTAPSTFLADHFTPGNVIFGDYWQLHDKVLEFNPAATYGGWAVRVIGTDKDGNPRDGEGPRWHSTFPDPKDRVVVRAPAEATAAPVTAPETVTRETEKKETKPVKTAPTATEPVEAVTTPAGKLTFKSVRGQRVPTYQVPGTNYTIKLTPDGFLASDGNNRIGVSDEWDGAEAKIQEHMAANPKTSKTSAPVAKTKSPSPAVSAQEVREALAETGLRDKSTSRVISRAIKKGEITSPDHLDQILQIAKAIKKVDPKTATVAAVLEAMQHGGVPQLEEAASSAPPEAAARIEQIADAVRQGDASPYLSMARAGDGRIKIGAKAKSLAKVLAANFYGQNPATVVTKELMQNAWDAVRLVEKGEVSVQFRGNEDGTKTIIVSDNGLGMSREELETVFTDLGDSGKLEQYEASGGFGLAKAAPFMMPTQLKLVTVSKQGGKLFKNSFTSTPAEINSEWGVELTTIELPKGSDVKTGTVIEATFPSKQDLWMAKSFVRRSHGSLAAPGKFVSEGTSPLDMVPVGKTPIATAVEPGANLSLYASTAEHAEKWSQIEVNNHGIYQFNIMIEAPVEGMSVPKRIALDVRSTVEEGDENYPFQANREGLRKYDLVDAIKNLVRERVFGEAAKRQEQKISELIRDLPAIKIGAVDIPIFDSGKRLSAKELKRLQSDPAFIDLAHTIHQLTRSALDKLQTVTFPEHLEHLQGVGGKIKRIGIVFADNIHGVHITDPANKDNTLLFINPFLGIAANPEIAASTIWHTIKHEIVHDKVKGHNEAFTSAEVAIAAALGSSHELTGIEELKDVYSDPDDPRRIRPDLDRALQLYEESRQRGETAPDLFRGESLDQRAHDGADGGAGDETLVRTGGEGAVSGYIQPLKPERLSAELQSRQPKPQPVEPELNWSDPPRAGETVAGLTVGDNIPNRSSIYSSLSDPTVLRGIRELPLDEEWNAAPEKTFHNAAEVRRVYKLAEEIKNSGRIDPLIVGVENGEPHIIEGVHRLSALQLLGKKSFPALIAVEADPPPKPTGSPEGLGLKPNRDLRAPGSRSMVQVPGSNYRIGQTDDGSYDVFDVDRFVGKAQAKGEVLKMIRKHLNDKLKRVQPYQSPKQKAAKREAEARTVDENSLRARGVRSTHRGLPVIAVNDDAMLAFERAISATGHANALNIDGRLVDPVVRELRDFAANDPDNRKGIAALADHIDEHRTPNGTVILHRDGYKGEHLDRLLLEEIFHDWESAHVSNVDDDMLLQRLQDIHDAMMASPSAAQWHEIVGLLMETGGYSAAGAVSEVPAWIAAGVDFGLHPGDNVRLLADYFEAVENIMGPEPLQQHNLPPFAPSIEGDIHAEIRQRNLGAIQASSAAGSGAGTDPLQSSQLQLFEGSQAEGAGGEQEATGKAGVGSDIESLAPASPDPKNPDILQSRQLKPKRGPLKLETAKTETPEFKRWFGDSQIVDEDGKPLVLYHGTTADFDSFDASRGNAEADHGAGFYFTDSTEDVSSNYAGFGPDLTGKIERRAENLAGDFYGSSEEELEREFGTDYDPDHLEMAKAIVTKQLAPHGGVAMPVYLKMENPVRVGGTRETFFDFEEPYDEQSETYGEPEGTLWGVIESLRRADREMFDGDIEKTIDEIVEEAIDGGGISASKLQSIIKSSDGTVHIADEDGKLVSGELLRRALQDAGYDGIIDRTVDKKFGSGSRQRPMAGVTPSTTHYIVFNPTQIKSAIGNRGTFDPESQSILQSRQLKTKRPLSLEEAKAGAEKLKLEGVSTTAKTETPEFKSWFKDSKVVGEDGKPLQVYHGTTSTFSEFGGGGGELSRLGWHYFTDNPKFAEKYALSDKPILSATSGPVTIATKDGTKEVKGAILNELPGLAITQSLDNPKDFTLTHMESGFGVATNLSKEQVTDVVNAIRNLPIDWSAGKDAITAMNKSKQNRLVKAIKDGERQWMNSMFGYKQGARGLGRGSQIVPTYLSMQNPLDLRGLPPKNIGPNALRTAMEDAGLKLPNSVYFFGKVDLYQALNSPENAAKIREAAKEAGYDGIIFKDYHDPLTRGTSYIAFEPTQIKSAIGNRGTYDPKELSILRSKELKPKRGPLKLGERFGVVDLPKGPASFETVSAEAQALKEAMAAGTTKGRTGSSVTLRNGSENLSRFGLKPGKSYTTREIAEALQTRQRRKNGGIAANDRSPESAKKIGKWMAEEVQHEMKNPEKSGVGWYSKKFQRSLDLFAEEFPELKHDQDARDLFTVLIAVSSDGAKVYDNFRYAADLYRNHKKTGEFTTKRGHPREASVRENVAIIANLLKAKGPEGMRDYLMQERTVSELMQIAKSEGRKFSTEYQAHIKLPMAALIFGPKLGAFYANLMGAEGYLTMDRWWSRSFNRYRGDLLTEPTDDSIRSYAELIGRPRMTKEGVLKAVAGPRDALKARGYKTIPALLMDKSEPGNSAEKAKWTKRLNALNTAKKLDAALEAAARKAESSKKQWTVVDEDTGEEVEVSATKAEEQRIADELRSHKGGKSTVQDLLRQHNIERAANTIYKMAFENVNDAPNNATDRTFMLSAAVHAQKLLQSMGIWMSIADIQATLWYYEKRLYGELGARQTADVSYEETAHRIVGERAGGDRPGGRAIQGVRRNEAGAGARRVPAQADEVRPEAGR